MNHGAIELVGIFLVDHENSLAHPCRRIQNRLETSRSVKQSDNNQEKNRIALKDKAVFPLIHFQNT